MKETKEKNLPETASDDVNENLEEKLTTDATQGVESLTSEKGEVAFRRYSKAGFKTELQNLTWLKPKEVITATFCVLISVLILVSLTHGLDSFFSNIIFKIKENTFEVNSLLTSSFITLFIVSSLTSIYYAFKHPSPGDTLASIFGGQLVAQGAGVTPRVKKLRTKMIISVTVFLLSSLALAFVM